MLIGIDDKITENELINFCKQTNSWDFIQKKPNKLNTFIGDRGVQLSGGQKQLISLTRALIRKPQILILDEATSSLDQESESAIRNTLIKLSKSKQFTIIIIAHRFSTIQHANKIYEIRNGKANNLGNWSDAKLILDKND